MFAATSFDQCDLVSVMENASENEPLAASDKKKNIVATCSNFDPHWQSKLKTNHILREFILVVHRLTLKELCAMECGP